MAIIHRAELKPSKIELITTWLDGQTWGGSGEVTALGAYRYDDPDGQVGMEGHLVSRDGVVLHVPLTYRGAPLDDPDAVLVGELEHSVLGRRYVYDAVTDPVAVGCLARALTGDQQQAELVVYDGDTVVGQRDQSVTVRAVPGNGEPTTGCAVVPLATGHELSVARVDADRPAGSRLLVATWAGGSAVIAALR